jgi:hypothetical protein
MHVGLITFLNACAVMGLTLFGASITLIGWRAFPPDLSVLASVSHF